MKTNNLILMLLVVAVSFLLGSTYANQAPEREDGRTEVYAILTINPYGFNLTTSSGFTENKSKIPVDKMPVVAMEQLNKLNAEGFQLFSTNFTGDQFQRFYTYTFKRKL